MILFFSSAVLCSSSSSREACLEKNFVYYLLCSPEFPYFATYEYFTINIWKNVLLRFSVGLFFCFALEWGFLTFISNLFQYVDHEYTIFLITHDLELCSPMWIQFPLSEGETEKKTIAISFLPAFLSFWTINFESLR